MPPRSRTRQAPAKAPRSTRTTRSSKRATATEDYSLPEVFRELISEATPTRTAGADEGSKPLKKRKTRAANIESDPITIAQPKPVPLSKPERARPTRRKPAVTATTSKATRPPKSPRSPPTTDAEDDRNARSELQGTDNDTEAEDSELEWEPVQLGNTATKPQTITDDEEESEESEHEWEQVELGHTTGGEDSHTEDPVLDDIAIVLGGDNENKAKDVKKVRRKGITAVDKKQRLDVHKIHVLCLLYHAHMRNAWCNDEKAQSALRNLPLGQAATLMLPHPADPQHRATQNFWDGLKRMQEVWAKRFAIKTMGMHKPRWADSPEDAPSFDFDELEFVMSREDFRKAATAMQGSQDLGVQLFCTLLRSHGIEARLVCSLQCLPFASAAQSSKTSTPQKPENRIVLDPYKVGANCGNGAVVSGSSAPTHRKPKSKWAQRNPQPAPAVPQAAPKRVRDYRMAYPVYWVEAWSPPVQKWIVIDPFAPLVLDKASKLEPPLSSLQNQMVYVVAFEDDGVAKDVTRKYAKAYNAKTRKFRVESTEGGDRWWKQALKPFRRRHPYDRDQIEDAALARKEAAEGIPRNVQDFKDHPVYALERHLRQNEVIHPRNQVGKINAGTTKKPSMESIYRRRDVHVVRSADKWYRLGRDVKGSEQPLKHAKPRKGGRRSVTPGAEGIPEEEEGVGLYMFSQTELYVPPPVIRGRVPRNGFGNLDIYVPSMIPKGGVHIQDRNAANAARIVGIDFADAVTGFQFKGRHGTAIVQGIIVAQEYQEAVETVLEAMEYAQEQAENAQRTAEALRLWRRFFLGLKIVQRVNAYEVDGKAAEVPEVQEEIDHAEKEDMAEQMAGGFFPDERAHEPVSTKKRGFTPDYTAVGFLTRESHEPAEPPSKRQRLTSQNVDLVPGLNAYYDAAVGGGFIREKSAATEGQSERSRLTTPELDALFEDDGQDLAAGDNDVDMAGGFVKEGENEGMAGGFVREDGVDKDGVDMAGGFVRDAQDEDMAGGFVREDEDDMARDIVREEHDEASIDGSIGGNDPYGKHTQPQEPAAISPSYIRNGPSVSPIHSSIEESAAVLLASPSKSLTSSPKTQSKNMDQQPQDLMEGEAPSPAVSTVSNGSLPLEDPDDEDADPEWLVDVT